MAKEVVFKPMQATSPPKDTLTTPQTSNIVVEQYNFDGYYEDTTSGVIYIVPKGKKFLLKHVYIHSWTGNGANVNFTTKSNTSYNHYLHYFYSGAAGVEARQETIQDFSAPIIINEEEGIGISLLNFSGIAGETQVAFSFSGLLVDNSYDLKQFFV